MIRADEKARPIQFRKNLPIILTPAVAPAPQMFLTLKDLENKIHRLEDNWSKMNEAIGRKLDQAETRLLEYVQGHDPESKESQIRPGKSMQELWGSVHLEKKVEANTDGITKV